MRLEGAEMNKDYRGDQGFPLRHDISLKSLQGKEQINKNMVQSKHSRVELAAPLPGENLSGVSDRLFTTSVYLCFGLMALASGSSPWCGFEGARRIQQKAECACEAEAHGHKGYATG